MKKRSKGEDASGAVRIQRDAHAAVATQVTAATGVEVASPLIEPRELEFMNRNITSISQLKKDAADVLLPQQCSSLNLHCNAISRIADMADFLQLQHLDLSSNQISSIEGLNLLPQLLTLNLASNRIRKIEGLDSLKMLRKLILAHNQIQHLTGMISMHGPQYALETLDLKGNKISSMREVHYIGGCVNLRELYLQGKGGQFRNPVCAEQHYKATVVAKLPQLSVLDGEQLQNRNYSEDASASMRDSTTYYPVLAKYARYIKSDTEDDSVSDLPVQPRRIEFAPSRAQPPVEYDQYSGYAAEQQVGMVATPRIDRALSKRRAQKRVEKAPSQRTFLQRDTYEYSDENEEEDGEDDQNYRVQKAEAIPVRIVQIDGGLVAQLRPTQEIPQMEHQAPISTIHAKPQNMLREEPSDSLDFLDDKQTGDEQYTRSTQTDKQLQADKQSPTKKPIKPTRNAQTETSVVESSMEESTSTVGESMAVSSAEESSSSGSGTEGEESDSSSSSASSTSSAKEKKSKVSKKLRKKKVQSARGKKKEANDEKHEEAQQSNAPAASSPVVPEAVFKPNTVAIEVDKLNQLYEDLGIAKTYIQQREQELADAINSKRQVDKQLEQTKFALLEQSKRLQSTENKFVRLFRDHEKSREEQIRVGQKLAEMKMVHEKLLAQEKKVQQQLDEALEQLQHLRAEQEANVSSKQETKDYGSKYFDLLKQVNALKLNAEKDKDNQELREKQARLERETQFNELNQRHQQEINEFKQQIQEMELKNRRELQDWEDRTRQAEKQRAEAQQALEKQSASVAELEKHLKIAIQEKINASAVNAELAKTVKQQKKYLDEALRKKQEYQQVARSFESKLVAQQKRLSEELPKLYSEKQQMEEELKRKNEQLLELERKLLDQEQQLRSKDASISSIAETEIKKLKDQIVEHEQTIKIQRTCNDDLSENLKKHFKEIEALKKQVKDADRENERLQDRLDATVQQLQDKIERREDSISSKREEIEQLRQENEELQALLQKAQEREKSLAAKQGDTEQLRAMINKLESRKKKYRDSKNNLQSQVDQLRQEKAELVQKLTDKIGAQEQGAKQMERDMDEIRAIVQQREQQLYQCQQIISKKNADLNKLIKTIEKHSAEAQSEKELRLKAEERFRKLEQIFNGG